MSEATSGRSRRARKPEPEVVAVDVVAEAVAEAEPAAHSEGADREVVAEDLESSLGADPDHERRLALAHSCVERFAGRALPKVLGHHHAQGVQRLAEWLAITRRSLDVMPSPEEIPAVVRYHWRMAEG